MTGSTVNLFIYGSLHDSRIFQSVCGLAFARKPSKVDEKTLFAEPAFLPGHRRVSPDNVYYYAVPAPTERIEGLVIHDVPASAMREIDHYEGKRYKRQAVTVNTAGGPLRAQAYLVSAAAMRRRFGDRFHVNLIQELWLRKRIEKFIRKRTRPGDRTADAELERQAERELLATTERDLVISHYHSDPASDYYIQRALDRPRPSIRHLYDDPQARPFVRNYLTLVVKQVLLGRFDEQIQVRFRHELEHMRRSERYYARSLSLLAALQMINSIVDADLIVRRCLQEIPFPQHDLIDYVKYAVRAAKGIFDPAVAEAHLERIRTNLQPGLVPLGFELELSNLGAAAVEPQRSGQKASDPAFDGFRYFYDFRLEVLSWKVGGYVDDHTVATDEPRRTGFLELAPGRLNVAGELSRPATSDPWVLSRLIHELTQFYAVRPHSLHLSFQIRKRQIGRQRILPLGFVKCLLALGGGPELTEAGKLTISRLTRGEIMQFTPEEELVLARTSKRQWYSGDDDLGARTPLQATTHVQQYKFIRLDGRADYEPLVLCLKGLQLAYNPGDYLTAAQLHKSPKLLREYDQLKQWAADPTPIGSQTINRFLQTVRTGLMDEGFHKPVHELHYIDWALGELNMQLRAFNQQAGASTTAP